MATEKKDSETEIKSGYLIKQGKNILLSFTFISLRDCVLNAVTLVKILFPQRRKISKMEEALFCLQRQQSTVLCQQE